MARDHTECKRPAPSYSKHSFRPFGNDRGNINTGFLATGAHANTIARDITKNVLKDGRFQSYLALGGPAWLHQRIAAEASRQD
uniref:Uncharacterized protein n=1 Tax=Brassica oleracea var. oleracea TaxID=109376 RepID=A0A0D3BGS3_BRAOL